MKSFFIITAILFVAVLGCERHVADEPKLHTAQSEPSLTFSASVQPEPNPSVKELSDWLMVVATFLLVVATSILAYWAWKTASTAKTTEDVFKDIVKTLEDTQRRSEATAVVRTMSDCIKQYQDLENNLHNKKLKRPERYFELLWDLHFAEFQFFIRWFLPNDVYGLWVWVRYQSYYAREKKLGWTEFDGWKYGKVYLQDEKFASFIDGVFGRSGLKKEDVIRYVENYPRLEAGLTGMANQSKKPTGPISK